MIATMDLSTEQIDIIKGIIKHLLPQSAKVFLFGSRATGAAKPFSDIDLLVDLNRPCTLEELSQLELAFDESTLPYKVDIVDVKSISDAFKNKITPQLLLIE